jgi:hypothetical protein
VLLVLAATFVPTPALLADDRRDGAVFAEKKDARYDAIKDEVRPKVEAPAKKRLWVDFSKVDAPEAVSEFTKVWHQPWLSRPSAQSSTTTSVPRQRRSSSTASP